MKYGPDYLLIELHHKDRVSIYSLLKGFYDEFCVWHEGDDYSDVVFRRII
jgi:hypothetical protein